jgi:hypothetical protein
MGIPRGPELIAASVIIENAVTDDRISSENSQTLLAYLRILEADNNPILLANEGTHLSRTKKIMQCNRVARDLIETLRMYDPDALIIRLLNIIITSIPEVLLSITLLLGR